jgi:HEAT repeat protein
VSNDNPDSLLADLQASRYEKRVQAFNAISELLLKGEGDPRVGPLLQRLRLLDTHPDGGVRAHVLSLVGLAEGDRSLALLEAHALDAEPEVRAAIEDVAEDIGEPARPLLKRLSKDADFGVRFWAAVALSEMGDAEGYEVLVEGLATSQTRFEALQGMRRLGDKRAEAPVRKVFGRWMLPAIDKVAAAGVLTRLGDPAAKDALLKEMQRKRSDVRGLAMEIAGELKVAEAVPILEAVFRDQLDEYRGSAAMGLGSMKQERFTRDFESVLRDEAQTEDLRGDVAWALQLLGTDDALRALKDASTAVKDDRVREDIHHALQEHLSPARPAG